MPGKCLSAIAVVSLGLGACDSAGGSATPPAAAPVSASFPGAAELAEARRLAAAGQLATASDALAEGQRKLEEAAPLRIRNLTVVDAAVGGFGIYSPRENAELDAGEPLILYFEPAGMSRRSSGGTWNADFSVDVAVLDAAGNSLLSQKDFLVHQTPPSRQPNREIQFSLKLTLAGAPAANYFAEVRLHDKLGGETAVARTPFTIVP